MKKRLTKLQTVIIAFAVFVSFGLSAFHSFSEINADASAHFAAADHSHSDFIGQEVDCDGSGNHCKHEKTQHSHAGPCCPLISYMAHSDPVGPKAILSKMVMNNLIETLSAPPVRPPRLFV